MHHPQGHKNAVLEVHWMPGDEVVVSCSADKTVRGWDAATGTQIKKYKEHEGVVNSVCPLRRGPQLLVSASDDCTARLWDMRMKKAAGRFNDKFQLTAAVFAEAGDQVYTGGLDNTIKVCCCMRACDCVCVVVTRRCVCARTHTVADVWMQAWQWRCACARAYSGRCLMCDAGLAVCVWCACVRMCAHVQWA